MKRASSLALTSPTEPPEDRIPEDRIVVGTVGKPHGLDGTVVVHPRSDYPRRFAAGSRLISEDGRLLTVRSSHRTERILLVAFAEVVDRSAAESLRGIELTIGSTERRPLADGEYWPDQLVALTVLDPEGNTLGSVEAVDDSTVQSRLQIRTQSGLVEVPLVDELVTEIQIAKGYLVIGPIVGLFDGTHRPEV